MTEGSQLSAAVNRTLVENNSGNRSRFQKTVDSKHRLERILNRRRKYGIDQNEKSEWSDTSGVFRGVLCIVVVTLIIFSAYLFFYDKRPSYPDVRKDRYRRNLYNNRDQRYRQGNYFDRFGRPADRSISRVNYGGPHQRQFPSRGLRGVNGRSSIPRDFQNNLGFWDNSGMWPSRSTRSRDRKYPKRGESGAQAIQNYLRDLVKNRDETSALPEFDLRGALSNYGRNNFIYPEQQAKQNKYNKHSVSAPPAAAVPLQSPLELPVKEQIQNTRELPAIEMKTRLQDKTPSVDTARNTGIENEKRVEEIKNPVLGSDVAGNEGLLMTENVVKKLPGAAIYEPALKPDHSV